MIIEALYYFLPAYMANMAPVLLKGQLKSLDTPLDGGRTWRGKRVLGSHKTWRGLVGGAMTGVIVFWLQKLLHDLTFFQTISIIDYSRYTVLLGLLLGTGALLGDAAKSFLKRQIGIKPGKPWPVLDQLDFVVGGLLLSSIIFLPEWRYILVLLLLTPILHLAANFISYSLGLQKDKW